MALNFRRFFTGIQIFPKTSSTADTQGEMDVTSGDGKVNYYNGTTSSPMVTEAHSAVLTNKTLSGNTATNLINGAGTFNFNSTGTITTPNATDTLVAKNTNDVLTNKTLSGNTATNLISGAGTFTFNTSGTITAPNATDTLVGQSTTDTLSNKTLLDTTTTIANTSTPTKKIKFDASGITATKTLTIAGTSTNDTTWTIPNATDTAVGKATTDTLTNKTLTDSSTAIADSGDPTKQIKFDAAGTTGTSTTLTSSQTTDKILTLPNATDTLVGKATTDVFTNKTLSDSTVTFGNVSDNTKAAKFSLGGATANKTLTISSSHTDNRTMTVPDRSFTVNLGSDIASGAASSGQLLTADGAGGASFTSSASLQDSSLSAQNYTLTASVGSNALTINLKTKAGNDPSGGDPVNIAFRNATAATGDYTIVSVTSALSLTIPSGTTIGTTSGNLSTIFVYAIDNSGTVALGVSLSQSFDEGSLVASALAISTGANRYAMYNTSVGNLNNKPIRLLGRVTSTQATAGTWASSPSEISLYPFARNVNRSEVWLDGGNGTGGSSSGETKVRNYSNIQRNIGSAITYTQRTATTGDKFTINEDGIYGIFFEDRDASAGAHYGITLNSTGLSTAPQSLATSQQLAVLQIPAANSNCSGHVTVSLAAGDIIRIGADPTTPSTSTSDVKFHMTKITN